jgi:NhaA family Na+:H+ antiporter
VHASVAGVLVAATIPARPRIHPGWLQQQLRRRVEHIQPEVDVLGNPEQHDHIESLASEAHAATTPLRRWEHKLDMPVALLILPLFAFVNAGVSLNPALLLEAAYDPVALGIGLGLVVGKPLGIIGAALLAVRCGFGRLPPDIDLRQLLGLGLLAGIGFTMSTFIGSLALPEAHLELAKIAILTASLLAGLLGYLTLKFHRND